MALQPISRRKSSLSTVDGFRAHSHSEGLRDISRRRSSIHQRTGRSVRPRRTASAMNGEWPAGGGPSSNICSLCTQPFRSIARRTSLFQPAIVSDSRNNGLVDSYSSMLFPRTAGPFVLNFRRPLALISSPSLLLCVADEQFVCHLSPCHLSVCFSFSSPYRNFLTMSSEHTHRILHADLINV